MVEPTLFSKMTSENNRDKENGVFSELIGKRILFKDPRTSEDLAGKIKGIESDREATYVLIAETELSQSYFQRLNQNKDLSPEELQKPYTRTKLYILKDLLGKGKEVRLLTE